MTTIGRGHTAHLEHVEAPGSMLTMTASRVLAVFRISLGFVFLWAFLDKTFGWNYATPAARAWINGGSPTKGFLSSVDVGPLQSMFHSMAGTAVADWLFMLGLLGIGVGLILGIGMRITAAATTVLMAGMWFAEYPLAQTTSGGKPTMSANPITDYHFLYAVGAIALAVTYAGHTWGLGRWWTQLPYMQKNRWLI